MSKFNFLRKVARFKAQVPTMLDRMANNAVYQFKVVNFDSKGFVDSNIRRWAPIKDGDGRQPLVKTGRMRQSIRVVDRTFFSRTIGSDVPYFKYHNEGSKNLPERKMVGNSKQLELKNGKVILETIKKIV